MDEINFDCGAFFLPYEQEFAVFGQGPVGIVDDEFEFVDLASDGVEERGDGVVIGDGLRVFVVQLVGHLACRDELFELFLDAAGALCDFLDEQEVSGVEFVGL